MMLVFKSFIYVPSLRAYSMRVSNFLLVFQRKSYSVFPWVYVFQLQEKNYVSCKYLRRHFGKINFWSSRLWWRYIWVIHAKTFQQGSFPVLFLWIEFKYILDVLVIYFESFHIYMWYTKMKPFFRIGKNRVLGGFWDVQDKNN